LSAATALLEGLRVRACSPQTLTDRLRELAGGYGWRRVPQTPPAPVGHLRAAASWAIWWSGVQPRGVLSVWRTGRGS